MADEVVYTGTADNAGNGDPLRTAMAKINQKFVSVQAGLSPDAQNIVARVEAARDEAEASEAAADISEAAAAASAAAAAAARDAAQLSSGVYATTAAGLAATASGGYFSVPSAESAEYLILYLDNAGTAVEVKRYPSVAALAPLLLADEQGTARQRYLEAMRGARATWPKAAVVILLGQSLNAPRGTIVQAKAAGSVGKMPVGGSSITNWDFFPTNATQTGHWNELASAVDYAEEGLQTPGVGIIAALAGGKFPRVYLGNVAIGARSLEILKVTGPLNNLWATINRLCQIAIADGFDPVVSFYTAHGEANAAAGTTEEAYYTLGVDYYGVCQLYAAQAMRKPDYLAPIVFTYPAQQSGGGSGENDRAIKRAIKRLAADLPNALDLGAIYQWPVEADRVHPTAAAYVQRGEAVGRALRQFFEHGARWQGLHITDVTLSSTTFVATFSAPIQRDATLGVGENLNAALAEDGLEWIDNGAAIAISGLVYSGWKVTGTLASAPTGTLAQQVLRVAVQTTTGTLTSGASNLSGSLIRSTAPGWPSLIDGAYTNYQYASPQTFTSVRAA